MANPRGPPGTVREYLPMNSYKQRVFEIFDSPAARLPTGLFLPNVVFIS
jgi:hypothetical protein